MFTQLSRKNGGGELVAVKPIATVLRDYQLHGSYTPGPLYAFVLAAGLAGSLPGLVRRRTPSHRKHTDWGHSHRKHTDWELSHREHTDWELNHREHSGREHSAADKELASACLLVTLSAAILLVRSDAFEFSWCYQLPAVIMLPLAGALGLTAVAARRPRYCCSDCHRR